MAVFRVERTRDYTVMSNCHLRDKRLSLKAKGLLSQMLSLPEDWDYTLAGLSCINKESKDAIRSAVNELERTGYIQRHQTTDAHGKFSGNEYIIYERPAGAEKSALSPSIKSSLEKPSSENPTTENPTSGKPLSENPTQLNTKKLKKEELITDEENTDSIPFGTDKTVEQLPKRKERAYASVNEISAYREVICENIDYECLLHDYPFDKKIIDEIVELMVEVVSAKREYTRVAGSDFPHELVKSRLLKLDGSHIQFVLSCMKENTTKVKNIKQYLLTVLFNAPTTISNYYSSLVNYDMYGS